MNREKRLPPFLAFIALALFIKHKARHHFAQPSAQQQQRWQSHPWRQHCHHWHTVSNDNDAETPKEYV
jgi:hypothetical protein